MAYQDNFDTEADSLIQSRESRRAEARLYEREALENPSGYRKKLKLFMLLFPAFVLSLVIGSLILVALTIYFAIWIGRSVGVGYFVFAILSFAWFALKSLFVKIDDYAWGSSN